MMTTSRNRWGVFLIPHELEGELVQDSARVEEAMIGEHGEVGPRRWYEARHELFEKLRASALFHRVVDTADADAAVAQLAQAVDGRKRGTWSSASPARRRELARAQLAKIRDRDLRLAIEAALAHPAARDMGLWIETEAALPSTDVEPATGVEPSVVSAAEYADVARRLDELVAEGDAAWARAERERETSTFRASLCELTDEDARAAAHVWHGVDDSDIGASARAADQASDRCRIAAIEQNDEDKIAVVEDIEQLCERMPTRSLARNIYDARQARDLLAWLERQPRGAGRDRVLAAVRRAVANGHAFAIVFSAA